MGAITTIAQQTRQGLVQGAAVPIPAAAAGGSVRADFTVALPPGSSGQLAGPILYGVGLSYDQGTSWAGPTAQGLANPGHGPVSLSATAAIPSGPAPGYALASCSLAGLSVVSATLTFFDPAGHPL